MAAHNELLLAQRRGRLRKQRNQVEEERRSLENIDVPRRDVRLHTHQQVFAGATGFVDPDAEDKKHIFSLYFDFSITRDVVGVAQNYELDLSAGDCGFDDPRNFWLKYTMNLPSEWMKFFDPRAGRYRVKHKGTGVVRDTLMDIGKRLKEEAAPVVKKTAKPPSTKETTSAVAEKGGRKIRQLLRKRRRPTAPSRSDAMLKRSQILANQL